MRHPSVLQASMWLPHDACSKAGPTRPVDPRKIPRCMQPRSTSKD